MADEENEVEEEGEEEIGDAVLPDLEPSMISLLEGKSLCDVMSLALQRASVLRADQLSMFKTAGSSVFENGKALIAALKSAAGNEALPENVEHWVSSISLFLFPPFFFFNFVVIACVWEADG